MVFDPSVFFGMADIHDQHRDMRLDVDNMSYEVNDGLFFLLNLLNLVLFYCTYCLTKHVTTGALGSGRTHWKCVHWSGGRDNFEPHETAEVYIYYERRSNGAGALLYLSGTWETLQLDFAYS